jgi:predicted RecB family nuclease
VTYSPDTPPPTVASSEGMRDTTRQPRLLTPSKVTAWLDCAHFLTLQHEVDDGVRPRPSGALGELARLLMAKGVEHEHDCLATYQDRHKQVYLVPERGNRESFSAFVDRVDDVLSLGHEVVYQMPFVHDTMRGIADFLVRIDLPDGTFTYEPVDAKLARKEAKPGHVLQLCFYADAIEARLGVAPGYVHLWLGSGRVESIRLADVRAYWRRLRKQLKVALEPAASAEPTAPVKCTHCTFCDFADVCDAQWRKADALQFVAGIRGTDTVKLEADGVTTLAGLAMLDAPVPDLKPERQARLAKQASLQVEARGMPEGTPLPYELIKDASDEERAAGLAALPEPDDGDVFLDYEGHPFWRADAGLFFLFGLLTKGADGRWVYEAQWAHSKEEEGTQAKALIEYFAERRAAHPGMHVYHYNHTERSALETMAAEHGADQVLLKELVDSGLFVDLLPVVRNGLQAGVESYGLKYMEQLAGYERSHDIDKGASAVVEYEKYTHDREAGKDILPRIATYNEDDVRATRALRDWLVEQRDEAMDWREAVIELDESKYLEIDAQVAALVQFDTGTPQRLMGNLLGYWLREWLKHKADLVTRIQDDPVKLFKDPEAIVDLRSAGMFDRTKKNGDPTQPGMHFTFPSQPVGKLVAAEDGASGQAVAFATQEGTIGYASVIDCKPHVGTLDLVWKQATQDLGVVPSTVVFEDWVGAKPKPEALSALAGQLLADDGSIPPVAMALLRNDPPRFTASSEPTGGRFSDRLDDALAWVLHLDGTFVPIQGPPGTGKTWTGAHLVHGLAMAGKRVGVTAMSHAAIDNLLRQILQVFEDKGDCESLLCARRSAKDSTPESPCIATPSSPKACANPKYNLVAGTTWFFANKEMQANPVDVLIVDEAGQLALADALATTGAAHNLVLLGDPSQLAQVASASHPDGSGASVLEHVLGEHTTVPDDRGVFLSVTRRMHPDLCTFISEQIYDGRLTSFADCAVQTTAHGTGLRWLQAHHTERSKESPEEADLVAEAIAAMIGSSWTDHQGVVRPMTVNDFMVVAPYNDQVRLLRRTLDADQRTHGVPVGTVDKFQGQEAPVVFFTMTTSTAAEMPRDPKFLFSRNRLNVALSRARCLAFLVCTEELLNSRARDLAEMKLIATLCAAVDHAEKTRKR